MGTRLPLCRAAGTRMGASRRGRMLLACAGALGLAFCTACVADVYAVPHPSELHHGCRVPPGHLPPPGTCRVWYPGLPPGQQPPPGECHELRYDVPDGACLVYGE